MGEAEGGGMRTTVAQCLIVMLAALLWEGGVRIGWLDPFFVSSPTRVGTVLADWLSRGTVWRHLWVTLAEAGTGFAMGLVTGIAAGFWLALSPRTGALFQPFLVVANALPRVSFAPLIVLWFGLGFLSKVVIVWSLTFFISFFAAHRGFKEVPPVLLKNARVLGATRWQMLRMIYLPASLAWVFSSLRVSVGFAFTGAVLGEFIGASAGVGYLIDNAQANFNASGVMAGLTVLTVCVILVDSIVNRVERRLSRWKNQTTYEAVQ
jgi:NitT/TauT family transport system permease protein